MKTSPQLSGLQISVLRFLWDHGEGTVADVRDGIARDRRLASTTVATLLSRLEKRGLVDHRTEGRQFVYRALVSESDVRSSMVGELTRRLFRGDVAAFVNHLLSSNQIEPGDLDRVKAIIAEQEEGLEGQAPAEDQEQD
jgi:BlaI family penicillinase repressor